MATAFLLRYQEACTDDCLENPCPTKTDTRVGAEQTDKDGFVAPCFSATATHTTKIPNESRGRDQDRIESQLHAFPRSAFVVSSATVTKIRTEQPDDPAGNSRVLPCPVANTKTLTFVRAEHDDNDPRQPSLRAIPRCS